MLMSCPDLHRNPGPVVSSTPKRNAFNTIDSPRITSSPLMNGNDYLDLPTDEAAHHRHSYPTSPVSNMNEHSVNAPRSVEAVSFTNEFENTISGPYDTETTIETGAQFNNSTPVSRPSVMRRGYRTIPNSCADERHALKQRLLSALSEMIPHKESLTLRLLVSYTIDEKDSDCIVIDETLCRQSECETKSSFEQSADSGYFADVEAPLTKRPRLHNRVSRETHVLDLSVHTDREETASDEAMDVKQEETSAATGTNLCHSVCLPSVNKTGEIGDPVSLVKNSPSATSVPSSTNPLLVSGIAAGQSNGATLLTNSGIPVVDSSVFTLLPLLQQQQRNSRLFEKPRIIPNNDLITSEALSSNLSIPETAESILLKELQAVLRASGNEISTNSIHESGSCASLNNLKQTVTTANNPCVAGRANSDFLNASLNASPLVGFPLLNAFTPDQVSAIQALLPSAPLLSTSLSTPNFTSLNLGSATLLNLKDKITGLETLGIMPTSPTKHLSQPVANLLGQLTVPQTNALSLRTLTTLSQLFNTSPSASTTTNNNNTNTSEPPSGRSGANTLVNNGITATTNVMGLSDSKLSASLSSLMSSLSEKHQANSLRDSLMGNNSPPNLTLTVSSTPDSIHKIGFVNSDSNLINAMVKSDLGNDLVNTSYTFGNGTNTYGSNHQFMFGRRLTHTRRFTCNQCRKNFTSLAELNRHTLEAHNSFKCTICSAHFTQRSNLQRHSLKHVGFKPFTCNLCKKEYYRKDHLVRHIEVTHPNHDPKMNITVHLTSSECLDYLDRLHAGKQTPSSDEADPPDTAFDSELQEMEAMNMEERTVQPTEQELSVDPFTTQA